MSISYIKEKIKCILWAKAGGRCQYDGCNEPLWLDSLTRTEFNAAYIAHIIADKADGPRGDKILSEQLKADISNLMLMCDKHHRLIDKEDVAGHPVEKLQEMKRKHEARIKRQTAILENRQSHIVIYEANIGQHRPPITWDKATLALDAAKRYPADDCPIILSPGNCTYQDSEPEYWSYHRENLTRHFNEQIKYRSNLSHLSVFALAPQPLLVQLGCLLSDLRDIDVYQKHREPDTWEWQESPNNIEFIITPPSNTDQDIVALNLSLSGTIENTRITDILDDEAAIWNFTIQTPNNDFMRSAEQLSVFRNEFRKLMDLIKKTHGQDTTIHLFPAVPNSIAVEIGRTRMPKADLPFVLYDQNNEMKRFLKTLEIN